jgi:hypothetical protein
MFFGPLSNQRHGFLIGHIATRSGPHLKAEGLLILQWNPTTLEPTSTIFLQMEDLLCDHVSKSLKIVSKNPAAKAL